MHDWNCDDRLMHMMLTTRQVFLAWGRTRTRGTARLKQAQVTKLRGDSTAHDEAEARWLIDQRVRACRVCEGEVT